VSGFRYVAPERLQFREGGGCLSLFGVPFFLAGLFLLATSGGAIPMSDPGDLGAWGRPLLGLMGVVFTSVGGALVFGRQWTTLDVAERAATTSWGLLVPLKARTRRLDEFRCVRVGFEAGDSDSADKFPVALRAHSGPDLVLSSPTAYEDARTSAVEAAKHLGFVLEDASGDHAVAVDPADADRPLQQRAAHEARAATRLTRPAAARSEVHPETAAVRIVIPHRPWNQLGLLLVLAPIVIPVVVVPWLWNFFQQTRTPEAVGLAFLVMFGFFFGVLPAITIVNGIVRSRRGYTEMRVSREGVTIRERRAWRTHTLASIDAADILDVDYGTRETGTVSARHTVEQKLMEAGHEPASLSPRMERLMAAAAKWTKGRGVIVKSRRGLTTFGQDLDDDEIRYLAQIVRQALVAR
jgi:hypothetical protein